MRKTRLEKPEEIDLEISQIIENGWNKSTKENIVCLYRVWGLLLRKKRLALNLTQTDIAKMMHVTFQQVQKYENGANHLSFDKIIIFCEKTGTGYGYFLNTLNGKTLNYGGNDE